MRCKYPNCTFVTRHPTQFYWREWQLCRTHAKLLHAFDMRWQKIGLDQRNNFVQSTKSQKSDDIIDRTIDEALRSQNTSQVHTLSENKPRNKVSRGFTYNILEYVRKIHFLLREFPLIEHFLLQRIENAYPDKDRYRKLYFRAFCTVISNTHDLEDLSSIDSKLRIFRASIKSHFANECSEEEVEFFLKTVTKDLDQNPAMKKSILQLSDDERQQVIEELELNFREFID